MYWIHRWFEKIATSLHSESNVIQEAIKEQERTIRDAAQASDEKCREIPGAVTRVAVAIETANADVETYEKPQRIKEYGLQRLFLLPAWITAIATILAFVAAGIYAWIANRQLTEMRNATKAADCSALVARNSAQIAKESTDSARAQMELDQRAWIAVKAINGPVTGPNVDFTNTGKTPARNVVVYVANQWGFS